MKKETSDEKEEKNNPSSLRTPFAHRLDHSAILTIIGIILLFSTAVIVTLIAPRYVDSTWTSPSSPYQVQMYEISDPHFYISHASAEGDKLTYVYHLRQGFSLLTFKESSNLHLIASPELEKFITREQDDQLKLTSHLLFLREPQGEMKKREEELMKKIQQDSSIASDKNEKDKKNKIQILELYDSQLTEAFSWDTSEGILQKWADTNFTILDEKAEQPYHQENGVIYIKNPVEFRISTKNIDDHKQWYFDSQGQAIKNLDELKSPLLGFHSREELISAGEQIYAIEGCWYCHTDQTRTLIEDVVLNGSDSNPAPPSSANEYIYQKITFPGTRRIGPDISRVGIKRPSRDWHKAHFWSPKTTNVGTVMPAFRHFFDQNSIEKKEDKMGRPNEQFEAIYQYMMTKGTRITPPTQAWWLGKDPINTKEIIEGQKRLQ